MMEDHEIDKLAEDIVWWCSRHHIGVSTEYADTACSDCIVKFLKQEFGRI